MDELDKDSVLDGLTGELDDYAGEKMSKDPGAVTITISAGKDKMDGPEMASGTSGMVCPSCGYEVK